MFWWNLALNFLQYLWQRISWFKLDCECLNVFRICLINTFQIIILETQKHKNKEENSWPRQIDSRPTNVWFIIFFGPHLSLLRTLTWILRWLLRWMLRWKIRWNWTQKNQKKKNKLNKKKILILKKKKRKRFLV